MKYARGKATCSQEYSLSPVKTKCSVGSLRLTVFTENNASRHLRMHICRVFYPFRHHEMHFILNHSRIQEFLDLRLSLWKRSLIWGHVRLDNCILDTPFGPLGPSNIPLPLSILETDLSHSSDIFSLELQRRDYRLILFQNAWPNRHLKSIWNLMMANHDRN